MCTTAQKFGIEFNLFLYFRAHFLQNPAPAYAPTVSNLATTIDPNQLAAIPGQVGPIQGSLNVTLPSVANLSAAPTGPNVSGQPNMPVPVTGPVPSAGAQSSVMLAQQQHAEKIDSTNHVAINAAMYKAMMEKIRELFHRVQQWLISGTICFHKVVQHIIEAETRPLTSELIFNGIKITNLKRCSTSCAFDIFGCL